MAWAAAVILFWVWTLPFTEPTESNVICIFSEDCILPCSFQAASDEVIHWNRNQTSVHAYYHDADRLTQQDHRFKGRTFLFKDLIKKGNASLLLRNCTIQDSGRYHCYTSTKQGNQDKLVNMKVHAPIQSVNITKMGQEVICSSQDIYPAPSVSWATDPPTQSDMLNGSTPTTLDLRGLYLVWSKIMMLGNVSDYTYICSVTSADGMKWTTSMRQQEIYGENGGDMTIPCLAPETFKPHDFTLTWTLTRANKSEVILTFQSLTRQISNQWKSQARVDPDQVLSGNGSLWLQNLRNAHTGTYSCTFSAFQIQHLVHTDVILAPRKDDQGFRIHASTIAAFVLAVLLGFIIFSVIHLRHLWSIRKIQEI
ncbi:hypothetical protein SKAU_G00264340 [Synaphobranchus kaupii]|uniref:Ig-like domain-containing protein n=1 Tax=Synaphobranchus kaupii TaxID=118154 RepID=A0A9Q1EYZ9_SYNKA|nr:hypothetical protein SKAU_G00264340 [Synaphobranchus kaupii]